METKTGACKGAVASPITLVKPPVAVQLEDLRRIEALLRERGPCHIRRFEATYASLDDLLADHPLPLKRIRFETPEMQVDLEPHRAIITGQPGDGLDAMATEIDRLKQSPFIRFANPIRLALAVAFFVAIYQDALAWVIPPFVAVVLFERGVDSALARKGAMVTLRDRQCDARMSWGIFVLVMVVARVVVMLMGGIPR